jgi:DNA repair protein RecO (recombination protein O)
MIHTSHAIVLRVSPFSRTSHVVTWLTRDRGKIATVVKGATRPKSLFLGQYDLFYTCELLYYERERNGLHIIRECAPLRQRPAFRHNWRACAAASYASDLLSRTCLRGHDEAERFALAEHTLNMLEDTTTPHVLVLWFELTLMHLLGLEPKLSLCPACGVALPPGTTTRFSARQGGALCTRCPVNGPTLELPPDSAAVLAAWQRADTPRAALRTRCSAGQLATCSRLLGEFLAYHLDMHLPARTLAVQLMDMDLSPITRRHAS